MLFDYLDITKFININYNCAVYCGCRFCRNGKMREDVQHYKLYGLVSRDEYYLNIDTNNNLIEFIEKL